MVAAKTAAAYRLRSGEFISGSVPLTAEQVLEVKSLLQDPKTYEPDRLKGCIPNPGVLIRFEGEGEKDADLELCFECNVFIMHPREAGLGMGQVQNFDAARPQFTRLVKALFPKDKIIQGLSEDWPRVPRKSRS